MYGQSALFCRGALSLMNHSNEPCLQYFGFKSNILKQSTGNHGPRNDPLLGSRRETASAEFQQRLFGSNRRKRRLYQGPSGRGVLKEPLASVDDIIPFWRGVARPPPRLAQGSSRVLNCSSKPPGWKQNIPDRPISYDSPCLASLCLTHVRRRFGPAKAPEGGREDELRPNLWRIASSPGNETHTGSHSPELSTGKRGL
ncbi:hypothetical protein LY78DRAFT_657594 [Colletotrichum sublineola]|nr:hypothetical protein LY78DRAFT_657594 [Colletotrichum sublineola]